MFVVFTFWLLKLILLGAYYNFEWLFEMTKLKITFDWHFYIKTGYYNSMGKMQLKTYKFNLIFLECCCSTPVYNSNDHCPILFYIYKKEKKLGNEISNFNFTIFASSLWLVLISFGILKRSYTLRQ